MFNQTERWWESFFLSLVSRWDWVVERITEQIRTERFQSKDIRFLSSLRLPAKSFLVTPGNLFSVIKHYATSRSLFGDHRKGTILAAIVPSWVFLSLLFLLDVIRLVSISNINEQKCKTLLSGPRSRAKAAQTQIKQKRERNDWINRQFRVWTDHCLHHFSSRWHKTN